MSEVLSITEAEKPATRDLDAVFTPMTVGPFELPNRLICSPISINLGDGEGQVTEEIIRFYSKMAESGVSMVTIGASAVSPEGGSTRNGMRVGPAVFEPGLKRLAAAVKAAGARVSLQIFHVGAQGNTEHSGQPVRGPSTYLTPDIGIEATPLTVPQIERIEDEFANAISSGLDCGFDFVEIHAAHGYLLHEFMSPFFNHRDDAYGGSTEKRLQIHRNIVAKTQARRPDAFRQIGVRISSNDFVEEGLTLERVQPFVDLMNDAGIAYWVVSAGIYETAASKYTYMKEGGYYRDAAVLRQRTDAPVVAQGGVRTPEAAATILNKQQADLVGMAQALIADPDLVRKAYYGQAEKIIPCVECGRCRYIKREDLTFDCVRPEGYHPENSRWLLDSRKRSKLNDRKSLTN